MELETAMVGVALALPVWLLVEELVHRASRRLLEPRAVARSASAVPAARAA
jgi:hypothetical protein